MVPLHADLYYIDHPTPVSLQHGEFALMGRLQPGGGLMARAGVGLFNRLTVGISYSVDSFMGASTPQLAPLSAVGFQARLLGLEEGTWVPSLLVGFESQGYDGYNLEGDRFVTLPPGAYLVAAKTIWSTRTEISLGANYKPPPGPTGFDAHIAIREFYPADWSFLLEYAPMLNDPGGFPGMLNFGITRALGSSVQVKFAVRDMLRRSSSNWFNRVLELSLQQHF